MHIETFMRLELQEQLDSHCAFLLDLGKDPTAHAQLDGLASMVLIGGLEPIPIGPDLIPMASSLRDKVPQGHHSAIRSGLARLRCP